MSLLDHLGVGLREREAQGLYRRRRVVDATQGIKQQIDGREVLSFCSNDYLGLATDQRLAEAMRESSHIYGVGSGAAHLISGHTRTHHQLEEELADFVGAERALLFSTGYMANLGVLGALLGRGDTLLQDKLNHASLIDGAMLSQAKLKRYLHNDMDSLRRIASNADGDLLIASDAVFSMDGDVAPLKELVALTEQADAALMIDDAHGFGVLGEDGRGTASHFDLSIKQVPIYMATLGKALGTAGAFVAGSNDLIETLVQRARPYVYTTAMPAAVAEATRKSLSITKEESWRREHLAELIVHFRKNAESLGLRLLDSFTAIQPILLGDVKTALAWHDALLQKDILVTAIRPPTVPKDSARLRVTFSAQHQLSHVDRLLDALKPLAEQRS